MEAVDSLSVLLKYARIFGDGHLPYMVVGAHAVMVHGLPRFTADLDVVVHLPFEHNANVRRLLEEHGIGEIEERRDEFGQRLACVTPEGPPLEVFFTPPNPLYDREYERRVSLQVQGSKILFLSAEDLVLRKLVNARLRRGNDFDDAVSVAAMQGKRLDVAYLREHCRAHRVCDELDRVIEEAREFQAGD